MRTTIVSINQLVRARVRVKVNTRAWARARVGISFKV